MVAGRSRVVTLSADLYLRILGYLSEASLSARVIALKEGERDWEDGSVSEVLALHVQGPNFDLQDPFLISWVYKWINYIVPLP